MKLESLKLWRERELLSEEIPKEYGLIGLTVGAFRNGSVDCSTSYANGFNGKYQYELSMLLSFLQSETAEYFLRDYGSMTAYCNAHPRDRVPYRFNRECWGFRILTEHFVWYIGCTPWNTGRQFAIYHYDRETLMSYLAKEKGLPPEAYGIMPFTGDRIFIRFGDDDFVVCSGEHDCNTDNKIIVMAQNGMIDVDRAQSAAMTNGLIYGWDTPLADPHNYDDNGYLKTYGDITEKGVR